MRAFWTLDQTQRSNVSTSPRPPLPLENENTEKPIALQRQVTSQLQKTKKPNKFAGQEPCSPPCSLCADITEKMDIDWCYGWINELREWKLAHKHTSFDKQVHLMPASSDDLIGKLRAKLARLQEKMPAWQIIDLVKARAVLEAMDLERKLVRKRLDAHNERMKHYPESAMSESESGCKCKACTQPCKFDSAVPGTCRKDKVEGKKFLTSFVERHVLFMLKMLYKKLESEEEQLRHAADKEVASYDSDARKWYRTIYHDVDVPKLVGPLGERPLHICCLSAYRFEDVDFLGTGPYVKDGILAAVKAFLDNEPEGNCHDPRGEAYVPYGKDYCAAVGSAIARLTFASNHGFRSDFAPHRQEFPGAPGGSESIICVTEEPPYWAELNRWYHQHHAKWNRPPPGAPGRHKPRRQSVFRPVEPHHAQEARLLDPPERDMHALVTCGIFEGETIIFPIIAAGDRVMLHWLLQKEEPWSTASTSVGAAAPPGSASQLEPGCVPRNWSAFAKEEHGKPPPSLVEQPLRGLFFRPMHRHSLTSLSVYEGWRYYLTMRRLDTNAEASSDKSYFGLSPIAFAASRGDVDIFDMILVRVEAGWRGRDGNFVGKLLAEPGLPVREVRRSVLDDRDEYGNTVLHLAAWNDKRELFDRAVALGADARALNNDGLTPFTLSARYGVWGMFHHVWNRHMSATMWRFGNVHKLEVDHSFFDWRGPVAFDSRSEAEACLDALVGIFARGSLVQDDAASQFVAGPPADAFQAVIAEALRVRPGHLKAQQDLKFKYEIVQAKVQQWRGWVERGDTRRRSMEMLTGGEPKHVSESVSQDAMCVVRLITLFRPKDWHRETKDLLQDVVMRKWQRGYHLVHLGQNVIPYCVILALFGVMWWRRQLDVLEHNFWWAEPDAVARLAVLAPGVQVLSNPVRADLDELRAAMNGPVTGSSAVSSGRLPHELEGTESMCGWGAIRGSSSGALQAVLILYGVPSLVRLAWSQRRIRPTDLDENQDSRISFDELVNFLYFNLESLLHIVMSALLIVIGGARVAAGEECAVAYVRSEKSATAIAALFLFINLFIVSKPYKGIGLLVLTIYQFLVSDVFNFLLMYSIFFTAFLLGLQTLHNANHVYLSWMEITTKIAPQISLLTGNLSYLVNANVPDQANQLIATHMAVDGCQRSLRTIYDTAFTLLEISFGDGLADGLQEARRQDYVCPGFNPDGIVGYVIVFWVFLTNILVLNMLVAMMNNTLNRQTKGVSAVWLLDVSYRIMRYEQLFPELTDRMQRPVIHFSLWSRQYWESVFWDTCLAIYCVPEMHWFGLTRALYFKCKSLFLSCFYRRAQLDRSWADKLEEVSKEVEDIVMKERSKHGQCCINSPNTRSIQQKVIALGKREHAIMESALWSSIAGSVPTSLQALLLVSLIYQLDLLIRSFDDSRKIQKTIFESGKENGVSKGHADTEDEGMNV